MPGRTIPKLPDCPQSVAEALKLYREGMSAALTAAQTGLADLAPKIAETDETFQAAKDVLDKILGANPDPTTPSSVDEVTEASGDVVPTTDREELERLAAEKLDINIVHGVLFPKGPTNLKPLQSLGRLLLSVSSTEEGVETCSAELLGLFSETPVTQIQMTETLSTENGAAADDGTDGSAAAANGATSAADAASAGGSAADATRAANAASATGTASLTGDGFLLVTTRNETTETVVGSTCGEDIVEFEVVERPLGINRNINDLAAGAGLDADAVNARFYWLDEPRTDPATLTRLKALGLTPEELGAAVTGQTAGRLTLETIDTSIMTKLLDILTGDEICTLMERPETSGVNLEAGEDEIIAEIYNLVQQPTVPGVDSGLLVLSLIDWRRLFCLALARLRGRPGLPEPDEYESEECKAILQVVEISTGQLAALADQAQAFFAELNRLALGAHQLQLAAGLSTCLASFNIGLSGILQLTIGLPFVLQAYLAAFTALLAPVLAAVALIRAVLCYPQGIIQLLFGGICGFKPFDFGICPPDLVSIVERLVQLVNMVTTLVSKITGSLQTTRVDINKALTDSFNIRSISACSAPAAVLGVALGLLDETVQLTASGVVS